MKTWGGGVLAGHEPHSHGCHPERPSVGREGPIETVGTMQPVADAARRVLQLLLAALREIFDENAYARFLARHSLQPSRASYLQFLDENSRARERRPRCC